MKFFKSLLKRMTTAPSAGQCKDCTYTTSHRVQAVCTRNLIFCDCVSTVTTSSIAEGEHAMSVADNVLRRSCKVTHKTTTLSLWLRYVIAFIWGTTRSCSLLMLEERKRHGVPEQISDRAAEGDTSMSKMQRTKGAVGEREAAKMLNELVPNALAYGAQQHSGTESASDVIAPGMPNLWIEVKRVQALAIHKVIEKCREQCGTLTPVVMHRRNNEEWLVTIPLTEINRFAQQVVEAGDG